MAIVANSLVFHILSGSYVFESCSDTASFHCINHSLFSIKVFYQLNLKLWLHTFTWCILKLIWLHPQAMLPSQGSYEMGCVKVYIHNSESGFYYTFIMLNTESRFYQTTTSMTLTTSFMHYKANNLQVKTVRKQLCKINVVTNNLSYWCSLKKLFGQK